MVPFLVPEGARAVFGYVVGNPTTEIILPETLADEKVGCNVSFARTDSLILNV